MSISKMQAYVKSSVSMMYMLLVSQVEVVCIARCTLVLDAMVLSRTLESIVVKLGAVQLQVLGSIHLLLCGALTHSCPYLYLIMGEFNNIANI